MTRDIVVMDGIHDDAFRIRLGDTTTGESTILAYVCTTAWRAATSLDVPCLTFADRRDVIDAATAYAHRVAEQLGLPGNHFRPCAPSDWSLPVVSA